MRDVAIVAFAQLPAQRSYPDRDEVELVAPVIQAALKQAGLTREELGFICSGSCDYLVGRPFTFVAAVDGIGIWPPKAESHVEMDGAWALEEAWVRLQHGDVDTALVYAFGKSSQGDLLEVLVQQMDPYYLAPLGIDPISLAAMQARAAIEAGVCTEREMAAVAYRSRTDAAGNPNAQVQRSASVDALLHSPYWVAPLRKHDCPPISDGAAAIVLVAGDRARALTDRPAWIRGIDDRIEAHQPGMRSLVTSDSTARAAGALGLAEYAVDFAELHAPFTHQEFILRRALGLDDEVTINPSGGALAANPMMVAGLTRIGEAAQRLFDGDGKCAVAHATSGPCLQHNLVCVLETD
jgi:acetyl-CoA acetyltransferase